ncbi:putative membrane protein, partial [Vibrio parahaemolyticus AQ3810]
IAAQFRKKT